MVDLGDIARKDNWITFGGEGSLIKPKNQFMSI